MNFATALGLVIGAEYPNVMLEVHRLGPTAPANDGILFPVSPLGGSLQLLRGSIDPAFNALFASPAAAAAAATNANANAVVVPDPRLPTNLYFLLGDDFPACPMSRLSHASDAFCVHYGQLDVLPADRVDEWALVEGSAEHGQVEDVRGIVTRWEGLGLAERLPDVLFARFSSDPEKMAMEEEEAVAEVWESEGEDDPDYDMLQDDADLCYDPRDLEEQVEFGANEPGWFMENWKLNTVSQLICSWCSTMAAKIPLLRIPRLMFPLSTIHRY